MAGHPTYHVNVIKLKWEIIWTNGLPHLSGLPHLPGVPPPPCKQALKLDGEPVVPCISSYRETMVSHILISRSKPASVTPWRYTVWTLYLTTATTLRTSELWILSTNIIATSCTKFSLRCKKWMKNERKEVIWPTPTLSRDGYLMEFRPKMFARS